MAQALKNLLAGYGYNLVALPKTGIAPLQLLYKTNGCLGAVNSVLIKLFAVSQESAPPEIQSDDFIPDITGSATASYDSQTGFSLLKNLLTALHMGNASAKLGLNGDDTLTISYLNVTERKVDLIQLDTFIGGSIPNIPQFGAFREKLENGELYVINSVLKSNSFTLTVADKNGQKVDVAASIKDIVDATVDITHNKDNSITLKYNAAEPVIFAFKAQRILYEKSAWWDIFDTKAAHFRIKNQDGEVLMDESDYPTILLNMDNEMAQL